MWYKILKKYIGLFAVSALIWMMSGNEAEAVNTVSRAPVIRGAVGVESILDPGKTDEEFIQKSKERKHRYV